jgi:SAM-dependent methyltransferase
MIDIKQRQRQAWATGDYRTIGARLQIVSETLCEAVDLRGGQTVLDVATGTGNTAIAAARRWCDVTAIDYVPSLMEFGRTRAAAEGVPVAFLEGDAEEMRFPDNSFDVVLSTFGSMFAPNHQQAADELQQSRRRHFCCPVRISGSGGDKILIAYNDVLSSHRASP